MKKECECHEFIGSLKGILDTSDCKIHGNVSVRTEDIDKDLSTKYFNSF